tara:strand:- start:809 stop:1198 length:390 start_codon:yes stop_codon:yes gene_type:complete
MPLKQFICLHPSPVEVVEVVEVVEESEVFDPEAGKASDNPFHESIKVEEKETPTPILQYSTLTVKDLKGILKQRGLSTSGKKDDLILRLESDDEATIVAFESDEAPADAAVSKEKVSKYEETVSGNDTT